MTMKYYFIQYRINRPGCARCVCWGIAWGITLKSARNGLRASLGWYDVEFPGGWKEVTCCPSRVWSDARIFPRFHFYRW